MIWRELTCRRSFWFSLWQGPEKQHVPRSLTQEHGFALVLVLWMGLLIAIIAAGLLREAQSARIVAAGDAASLQASLIAEGAIHRAILSLIDPSDPLRWHIDGTPQTLNVLGHDVMVGVESEAGKIDLNAAPPSVLVALFRFAQLSPADSETLADRVLAWRSPVPPGAVDSTTNIYRDAGRSYGPRHGPFRSVGEVRMVLGMTDAVQAAVASALTVFSGNATVDRGAAGDLVLQALAAAGDGLAAAQLSARSAGAAAGVDRLPAVGEALTIVATVQLRGSRTEHSTVIRLVNATDGFYRVLEWH